MSCCGRGRSLQRPVALAPQRGFTASAMPARRPAAIPVTFEYAGSGALSVTGPFTGTTYTFAGKNARSVVNGADAPSLIGVPGLKPVR